MLVVDVKDLGVVRAQRHTHAVSHEAGDRVVFPPRFAVALVLNERLGEEGARGAALDVDPRRHQALQGGQWWVVDQLQERYDGKVPQSGNQLTAHALTL